MEQQQSMLEQSCESMHSKLLCNSWKGQSKYTNLPNRATLGFCNDTPAKSTCPLVWLLSLNIRNQQTNDLDQTEVPCIFDFSSGNSIRRALKTRFVTRVEHSGHWRKRTAKAYSKPMVYSTWKIWSLENKKTQQQKEDSK